MADDARPDEFTKPPQAPESDEVDQDPGERQKQNQNFDKDDPLAA